MPQHPKRAPRLRALIPLGALLIGAGCSLNPITAAPPTIPAARPAESPAVATAPAGTIVPLNDTPTAAIFDPGTSQLVVLCAAADARSPATVTMLAGAAGRNVIALPGPATALTGDGAGTAYLAARGGYFSVSLGTGRITRFDVDDAAETEFTAIAHRADGRLVLGSADGAVYTLATATAVAHRAKTLARVDAIVTVGDTAVALDRGQTSVTTIGADGRPRYALRAGEGATSLAVDPHGVVLAADTRGGQLLVYGVEPLMLRQAYPVRDAPYGIAGSRELAWVSQTATNTVIGYDLTTGIPLEKVRYPTVRQPNVLAFDDTAGTLYVLSGAGAGVQAIKHPAAAR